jgi:hypothetical protein
LPDEHRVLDALETAGSACAGWKSAGSLPSQLDENLIECSRTLFTAVTSLDHSGLLQTLVLSHQLVEKLAFAVRDVTACWLQQQQQAQQQQPAAGSSADAPARDWSYM